MTRDSRRMFYQQAGRQLSLCRHRDSLPTSAKCFFQTHPTVAWAGVPTEVGGLVG